MRTRVAIGILLSLAAVTHACVTVTPRFGAGGGTAGGAGGVTTRTVAAPPPQVAAAAVATFRQNGIPAGDAPLSSGVVDSGPFQVGPYWDGEAVDTRVDCGGLDLRGARVELRVVASATASWISPPGTTPPGGTTREQSQLRLESSGRMLEGGAGARCRLSRSFTARLADEIARLAGTGRSRFSSVPWR